MNLGETIRSLQNIKTEAYPEGIIVAEDIGAHTYCDINSNCPVAIRLRRLLGDTGISLEDLVAGYNRDNAGRERPLVDTERTLPAFSGNVVIFIGGKPIDIDLSDTIKAEFERATGYKVEELSRQSQQVNKLGTTLYNTYLQAIAQARKTKVLPQVTYPIEELSRYRCLITTNGDNYLYLFPFHYAPQWITQEGERYGKGNRYEISQEDAQVLVRECFLVFPVNREHKILRPYIILENGKKLVHYHGTGGDCWGGVKLPEAWNGSLKALADIAYQLHAAMSTINANSTMTHDPPGMPNLMDMLDRAKFLGAEGVKTKKREEMDSPPPRRWGTRR